MSGPACRAFVHRSVLCTVKQAGNTHVFHQKHRLPADLWTQIFHNDFRTLHHVRILQRRVVIQRLFRGVIFQRELLTANVKLTHTTDIIRAEDASISRYNGADTSITR